MLQSQWQNPWVPRQQILPNILKQANAATWANNPFSKSKDASPIAIFTQNLKKSSLISFSPATPAEEDFPPEAKEFVKELNEYRRSQGLPEVKLDKDLCKACQEHNKNDMPGDATDINHDGFEQRMQKYGVNAENVAGGQRSAKDVLKSWQDSPGHDENLRKADATKIGIAKDDKGHWTMVTHA